MATAATDDPETLWDPFDTKEDLFSSDITTANNNNGGSDLFDSLKPASLIGTFIGKLLSSSSSSHTAAAVPAAAASLNQDGATGETVDSDDEKPLSGFLLSNSQLAKVGGGGDFGANQVLKERKPGEADGPPATPNTTEQQQQQQVKQQQESVTQSLVNVTGFGFIFGLVIGTGLNGLHFLLKRPRIDAWMLAMQFGKYSLLLTGFEKGLDYLGDGIAAFTKQRQQQQQQQQQGDKQTTQDGSSSEELELHLDLAPTSAWNDEEDSARYFVREKADLGAGQEQPAFAANPWESQKKWKTW